MMTRLVYLISLLFTAHNLTTVAAAAEICPSQMPNRPQYSVVADLNYAKRTVDVRQDVVYTNTTGRALSQIVFNVETNRAVGAFNLHSLAVASGTDSASVYELVGQRLTLDLPEALPENCAIHLSLGFTLNVPEIGQGLSAFRGFFGYSARQLNLGHWLPTVAVYQGGDWVTHQATFIGEQWVLDAADWDITINVLEAASSLQVAAPGTAIQQGPQMWRFTLAAARDFTLSMSEQFRVLKQETSDGAVVELYGFEDALVQAQTGRVLDASGFALRSAAKSLSMYSDLFGAYPYQRLVIVQGDFPDGMEFSGIVFVSGDWFRAYDGTPLGYLMIITVHEVAHQWWYASVGSDSAMNPWLDEALATYSEYIFIEEYYPDLKSWWWQWRVDRFVPQGNVDSTVYQFNTIREYINAVYLRGVRMLHDLRQDLGTEAFFALLRQYAETGTGQIATPETFWGLLTPEQWARTGITRERYLQHP